MRYFWIGLLLSLPYMEAYQFNSVPYFQIEVGDGRSYENGYQAGGVFRTFTTCDSNQYGWVDLQFMRVDLGRAGSSCGVGWRSSSFCSLETFGAYVFYDTRYDLKKLFSQIGLGMELLSNCWEVRINGYLPVGKTDAFELSDRLDYEEGYFAFKKQYQSAMWGLDVEVGKKFCLNSCLMLYMGAGPYFYNTFDDGSSCSNALLGGAFRSLFYWKCVGAELFISYDPVYQAKVQGGFIVNLPLGRCCSLFYPCLRALRNRVIITRKTCDWITNY